VSNGGPPTIEAEEEIRIAEYAVACAVARSIDIHVESKAYPLILAEIKEASESVHDELLAFLAAYRGWMRRQRRIDRGEEEDNAEARTKLASAVHTRDRHAEVLSRTLAKLRASRGQPAKAEHPVSQDDAASDPSNSKRGLG
jgi:hypothetical protein